MLLLLPTSGGAADSSYCRKVQARAGQDAALLIWPRILAEGVRFPSTSTTLGPTIGGTGLQPRVGLTFSPTDLYQGVRTERAAKADCELHEVSTVLQEWVANAAASATMPALEAQIRHLDAHREEWQAILTHAQERLEAGHLTVIDLDSLRRMVNLLERKLETQRGERDRLRPLVGNPPASMNELVEKVASRSLAAEEETTLVGLSALQIRLTGGVIPTSGQPPEWFGSLEVTYSLGGLRLSREAGRYLDAREDEVKNARYELPSRAAAMEDSLRAQRASAARELLTIERELSEIDAMRRTLEESHASAALYALASLAVERMLLESDRAFLRALIEALPA